MNQTSEMGSGLTRARCLFGRIRRSELLPAEVDLQRREKGTRRGGLGTHLEAGMAQLAAEGSLRIGPAIIWEQRAFSRGILF